MNVCVLMLVKIPQGLDHRARFLRSRRAIEINQRMAMRLLAQNRKISADGIPIDTAAGALVHTTMCSTPRCASPLFGGVNVTQAIGHASQGSQRIPRKAFGADVCGFGDS